METPPKENLKKPQSGRKPKINPSVYRYSVNMTGDENARFRQMLDISGMNNISRFILSVIFGREIKVVRIDKTAKDYYIRLTNFHAQYQKVGNNYNQVVRALKTNFGEKRGIQMLHQLEKHTVELVLISKEVLALTREYAEKYLNK